MQLNKLKINYDDTLGRMYLIEEPHIYEGYKEGVKTGPEGLAYTVMSEGLNYDKVIVKIAGSTIPFIQYAGSPIQVTFDNIEGKLWQDFRNGGEIKLSLTAKKVEVVNSRSEGKSLRLNEK